MPKNAYAAHLQREVHRQVTEARAVHTQMCLDAAMIAANEVLHLGPGRAEAFAAAFSEALSEIATMTVQDTRDMEYTKAKIDGRLERICGEGFQAWDVRYSTEGRVNGKKD